jgi:hypothetical protein
MGHLADMGSDLAGMSWAVPTGGTLAVLGYTPWNPLEGAPNCGTMPSHGQIKPKEPVMAQSLADQIDGMVVSGRRSFDRCPWI